MSDFVQTVLLAIGALLPIVDPLAGAPIYQRLTAGLPPYARPAFARLVAFNSFLLLLGSALVGAYVLEFFGVSVPAVQVAGGILVCALAWPPLTGPDAPQTATRTSAAQAAAIEWRPRAFYPLTLPLTVGPGSISVALTLGANPQSNVRSLLVTTAAHAFGILVVAFLVYVCYRYADAILGRLGATGAAVLTRLSAFILLAIGVQIAWNGVRALLATLPNAL
ncbi:MAG TPA: MarC family protein [Burkholderiales bacterium]|nr:MarC family protein [Burkholderiales bacterium]